MSTEVKRETYPMLWDCLDNITIAAGGRSVNRYVVDDKWWSWLSRFESDLEKLDDQELNYLSTGFHTERNEVIRNHRLYNLSKMLDEFKEGVT